MKKFIGIFGIVLIFTGISGCTMQKPVSQAPVYNITVTDNSQMVVGDNNKSESKSETKTEQVAKPDVSTEAKSSGNSFWLFVLGVVVGIALTVGGIMLYKRFVKTPKSIGI